MAFSLTGNIITQSGTDANPEGLSAISGVTTIDKGNATTKRIVFDLGTLQLNIAGDLTHDPDVYEIIGNISSGIQVVTGAVYNYGIERTVNGRKTYSKGTGLVSTFQGNFFNQFGIVLSGGELNWNGGVIRTTGAISHSGCVVTSNSIDSVWQNVGISGQWRSTGSPDFKNITMQGINADCVLFLLSGWTNLAINFERAYYQTPASGGITRTVENALFANNQAFIDLATNQSIGNQQLTIAKNPDVVPRFGKVSNNAYADFQAVQSLNINLTDSEGSNAENVIAYLKDSDNGARKNATINGLPDGAVTNNYLLDRTYIANSDANGLANLGDILSVVAIHNNLTDGTMNLDYRSNYGNESVDFNIYLGGYEYNAAVTRQALIGNNGKVVDWTMFDDLNVSLSRANALTKLADSFSIDIATQTITVTSNSNYDDLYDITKAFKYNGVQINAETPTISDLIISANGSNLVAFNGWSLVVNSGVTLSSGSKFERITFATITNNGTITGLYQTSAGTSTTFIFGTDDAEITSGTSLVICNSVGVTVYYNAVTVDGVYPFYIAPQSVGEVYTYAIERYGVRRQGGTFMSNVGGVISTRPLYIEDVGISETDLSIVQAYTTISDTAQIYDATANYRLSESGIKLGQIVERDGTFLDFLTRNVVFQDDAASIVSSSNNTITYRALVINESDRYNAMRTAPPATITAADNELINVLIEDANGDSQLTILGGDNIGYELWQLPTATPTDDYETGTLLTTLTTNAIPYRFIGVSGFDIVGRDISSGVRRRSSMLKGSYTQAFYVGDQIQLATNAPQLVENNEKLDELILKVDTNLDAKVSTRLAELNYIAPENQAILDIQTKVDTLENTDLTGIALEASVQDVLTAVNNIEVDNEAIADAVWDEVLTGATHNINGSAGRRLRTLADTTILKEGVGTNMVNSGGFGLLTLEEGTTTQCLYQAIRVNDMVRFIREYDADTRIATMDGQWCEVEAGSVEYTLFNLRESREGVTLLDIENSTVLAKEATLEQIISDIDTIEVDNVAIAEEVWNQEPERLKNVATVQTVGDQFNSFQ